MAPTFWIKVRHGGFFSAIKGLCYYIVKVDTKHSRKAAMFDVVTLNFAIYIVTCFAGSMNYYMFSINVSGLYIHVLFVPFHHTYMT